MNARNMMPFFSSTAGSRMKKPPTEVNHTLKSVPKGEENLEAEDKEIVVTSDNTGLPATFTVVGNRHSAGGVKLNLPAQSFIFSRDKSMKITNEEILKMFNMAVNKKGYTPADIAKKYDINDFRKVLADKDTDRIQRDTAESMIANYNEKLAKLALVQEAKKGFSGGIPLIAQPYLHSSGMNPAELFQAQGQDEGDQEQPDAQQARFGGQAKFNFFRKGGENKAPRSNKGMVEIQYAKPLKRVDFSNNGQDNDEGEETLRRVRVVAPEQYQVGGQNKTKKGIPTYDVTEQTILKKLFPNVVLPEDVVESKQKKSGVGYGRFDKASADKNWAWYGKPIDWNNPKEVGDAQKAYNARIYDKLIAAGHPVDAAQKMVERIGFDPKAKGQPNALDNNAGKYTETRVDITPPPVEKANMVAEKVINTEKKTGDIPVNHVTGNNEQAPADFWLQDVIKTAGAAGDSMRIKKYLPWQAPYNPHLPNAAYYDPTRELAQNSESANISAQAAGMFGSPQELSARLSAIQGQAANNAANILGKYNNMNVTVSNQNEAQRTATLNGAAEYNATNATNLYDKNVIANQNFDNAKAMARQNLRGSFIDALTNRAQTQALNSTQHQFRVNPITGGTKYFTNPNMDYSDKQGQDVMDRALAQWKKAQGTGLKFEDVYNATAKSMGVKESPEQNPFYGGYSH